MVSTISMNPKPVVICLPMSSCSAIPMNHNVNDEGTAMLEIVHDMVPDADLYFHDSGNNWVAFNDAIHELKANGCTVICDDVYWSD